ncbi:MAG: DNA internalization-related competence protein ComEC/Rec2 [Clostridiales bacterium]|nr:DNA internalization-related competence protein ComEC/Rec2 [Clostridiales bacterium]
MKERLFCQMAAGVVCGILLARLNMGWLFFPVILLLLAGVMINRRKQQRISCGSESCWLAFGITAAILAAVCGYVRESSFLDMRMGYESFLQEGKTIYLQGVLNGKEEKNGQYLYELSSCQIRQSLLAGNTADKSIWTEHFCGKVQVSMESDAYSIGENLIIEGKISLWKSARNEGNFDAKSFYHAKGIEFQVKNPKVAASYGTPCRWKETLYQWKKQIKNVYQTQLPKREGGILTTMVLGDKSLLEEEVKEAYQTVGISHILAISGLHVSIIGMMVFKLLRRLRMGYCGAGIVSTVLLISYGEMVGFGSSVFRAVCMFLFFVAAQAAGRSYDSFNALGFAGVCLLIENPGLLFYAGFQFSFGAVLGVVLLGRVVKENTKGHPWLEKVLMGVAIQIATLPIVAWYYYEIPVYAVAVNLLVLPLMGVVLLCGITGGVLGLRFPGVAHYVFLPCRLLLAAYQKICDITKELPDPVFITGRPAIWNMLIYYGLLILLIYCYHRLRRKESEQNFSFRRTFVGIMAGGFLLLFLFSPKRVGFQLDVLDVGQGDGIFLRTQSGNTLFIDGGSTDVSNVGTYRIEPFLKYRGVRHIDCWVVSHTDYDHISGLQEILETDYPIDCLLFAKGIEQDTAYEKLVQQARKRGTEIVFMEQGQVLHFGSAKIRALSPGTDTEGDKNGKSLVLLYEENDFTGIFTGDIGTEQEKQIMEQQKLEEVDFYKAAHHGSKYSNSEEFLSVLSPAVAAVSCGENNRYGHPGEEAVAHMKEAGSHIFYTMKGGQIMVYKEKGEFLVSSYLEHGE